jgi:SAM-dependent methyltransferase
MLILNKSNWYKEFFDKYYLQFLGHKKNLLETKRETKFIYQVLNLAKRAKILDLACGFGRHAVRLAKKGFDVTCLDLNQNLLELAKKSAKQSRAPLRTVQSDMRDIPYQNEFDAVINMFSSFGYFKDERENLRVLRAVAKALKTNGVFLLDLPNKNWMLTKVNKKNWQNLNNTYILEERSWNKKKNIYFNEITLIKLNKTRKKIYTLLHLYELSEIKKKFEKVGFEILRLYGDYNGERFALRSSPRMIVLAKRRK